MCSLFLLPLFLIVWFSCLIPFLPSSDSPPHPDQIHLCLTNLPFSVYLMCSLLPHLSLHTLFLHLCVLPPSMSSVTFCLFSAICVSSLNLLPAGVFAQHSCFIKKLVLISLNDQSGKKTSVPLLQSFCQI